MRKFIFVYVFVINESVYYGEIVMLKSLISLHQSYAQAIKNGQNVGQKQLVTVWRNVSKEVTSGQYFEKKILPNGNIKTRILTIGEGNATPIGLETKVTTPKGGFVYKSIGVIKKNTSHLAKSVRELKAKLMDGTITKFEKLKLESLERAKNQNTKMYETNSNLGRVKDSLYVGKDDVKTLLGSTYGVY